VVVKTIYDQRL